MTRGELLAWREHMLATNRMVDSLNEFLQATRHVIEALGEERHKGDDAFRELAWANHDIVAHEMETVFGEYGESVLALDNKFSSKAAVR